MENLNHLLPGSRYGREIRDRLFTINVEVTGRCNSKCSFCHFYIHRDRKDVAYDIPSDQFLSYMHFINEWKKNIKGHLSYRFSGGDPIVLKDELFKLANLGYEINGIKPFVLTHGKGMNFDWIEKAKKSAISHIFLSIENPINPDKGALNPEKSIELLKKYNSKELPIILGVCVIPNENFKDLLEICDWFYNHVGYIPPIAEINYDVYTQPSEDEWSDLEISLDKVFKKYYGITPLNLFHSVSPELGYSGKDPYVFSLPLNNHYGINMGNITEKMKEVITNLADQNYPQLFCSNSQCDWWEFCDNNKWYWQKDMNHTREEKLGDYCRFKRLLNDTFYKYSVDINHKKNKIGIFEFSANES